MPKIEVSVKPELIGWAIAQNPDCDLGDKLRQKVEGWLEESITPTFSQIEELSQKTKVPLGYFFLNTPPKEKIKLLKYRTLGSGGVEKPSRELIDTVLFMESIQNWMSTYRQELGFSKLPILANLNDEENPQAMASQILVDLELEENWREKHKKAKPAFDYLRGKLQDLGIIVTINSMVNNSSSRPLDVDEFRAFALLDDWAPLIFINGADTARLFSLIHEAVHIWVGKNNLFNDPQNPLDSTPKAKVSKTETLCNQVTAQILVPKVKFIQEWNALNNNDIDLSIDEAVDNLAKQFPCSKTVIVRRLLDLGEIEQQTYDRLVEKAAEIYNQSEHKKEKKSTGGNFYRNLAYRTDKNFLQSVFDSIKIGRTTYVEAYRLTNTNLKTFPKLLAEFSL